MRRDHRDCMRAIDETRLTQRAVVDLIKKESPHCMVIAMTRQPNLWELFEARRAFFDDYLYLPVEIPTVVDHFERWIAKVSRWRRLDYYDRPRDQGAYIDRSEVRIRRSTTAGAHDGDGCDVNNGEKGGDE